MGPTFGSLSPFLDVMIQKENAPRTINNNIDWHNFRIDLEELTNVAFHIKTQEPLEYGVVLLVKTIQKAAWDKRD